MSNAPDVIKVISAQRSYKRSGGLGGEPSQLIPTGISSASAHCNRCDKEWRATPGNKPGGFVLTIGFVTIYCPNCGNSTQIHSQDIPT